MSDKKSERANSGQVVAVSIENQYRLAGIWASYGVTNTFSEVRLQSAFNRMRSTEVSQNEQATDAVFAGSGSSIEGSKTSCLPEIVNLVVENTDTHISKGGRFLAVMRTLSIPLKPVLGEYDGHDQLGSMFTAALLEKLFPTIALDIRWLPLRLDEMETRIINSMQTEWNKLNKTMICGGRNEQQIQDEYEKWLSYNVYNLTGIELPEGDDIVFLNLSGIRRQFQSLNEGLQGFRESLYYSFLAEVIAGNRGEQVRVAYLFGDTLARILRMGQSFGAILPGALVADSALGSNLYSILCGLTVGLQEVVDARLIGREEVDRLVDKLLKELD